jgi:hypothetical protein
VICGKQRHGLGWIKQNRECYESNSLADQLIVISEIRWSKDIMSFWLPEFIVQSRMAEDQRDGVNQE